MSVFNHSKVRRKSCTIVLSRAHSDADLKSSSLIVFNFNQYFVIPTISFSVAERCIDVYDLQKLATRELG